MASTEIAEIIARVHAWGGELTPLQDGNLCYRGPRLDDELRRLIRDHKPEITLTLKSLQARSDPRACLIPGCSNEGYSVELAAGLITRLCALHRRELFRRARELVDAGAADYSPLFETRPCRLCGRLIAPEDEPCTRCVAACSPLVQLAMALGARPLCACGAALEQPGDHCERCHSRAKP